MPRALLPGPTRPTCLPPVPRRLLVLGLVLACGVGEALAAEGIRKVADTKFSVRRGLFEQPFLVEITTKTPGATIRYTTDGSLPTAGEGVVYSEPVSIRTTTVLRAAAFKDGLEPSGADTQTYLFPSEVVRQTGAGFPAYWGFDDGKRVTADYEMDPEITGHAAYRDGMVPALKSLPSLSIVMPLADLFGTARGIYAHPRESGADWERAASVEWLAPDGGPGFQVDCGIRIQGGWNRRPEESPKHAFRLAFRKKYGAGKLRFPLFGEDGIREFDELILRAGCNNTWLHWNGEERRRGDYLRDSWMRASQAAMGHPSSRGRFVHLYLNGLYWGLYNPSERPGGPFMAAHGGGEPGDYDVRNASNLLEGDDAAWKRLIARLDAGVTGGGAWEEIGRLIDLPQFADYMLLNLYGANGDWDGASNWYAARRRQPPGPFRFFVWDGERTLEKAEDDIVEYDAADSPPRLFQRLRGSPEFRRLFAERARLHLTGDGVLTPARAAARFQSLVRDVDAAMVAESARWGDYRRDAHRYKVGPYELYTRNEHWRPETGRLIEDYFPRRTPRLIEQLRRAGLWEP